MRLFARYVFSDDIAKESIEEAEKAGLVNGQSYEMVSADVYAFSSYIHLKGFPKRFSAIAFRIYDESGTNVDITRMTEFYRGYEDPSQAGSKLEYSPLNIGLLKAVLELQRVCGEQVTEKGPFEIPHVSYRNSDCGLPLSEVRFSIGYFTEKDANTFILAEHGFEVPRLRIEKICGRPVDEVSVLRYIGLLIIKNDGSDRFLQAGAGNKAYILEMLKNPEFLPSLRNLILGICKETK